MSAHTPGPWYVGADDRYSLTHLDVLHTDVHTPGAASEVIAKVTCRVSWIEQQTANARLIASAPDLLAELQTLIWVMDTGMFDAEVFERARAAIAKATGA